MLLGTNQVCAQVESPSSIQLEQDELENENLEQNEEITIKRRNKVDLNNFLHDETLNQLILNKAQINAIRSHIISTGKCLDLLELQSIGIITYANYLNLLEIIDIKNQPDVNEQSKINILNRSAYQNTKTDNSIGNNWSNYQQVKITINNQVKAGFAREFDIGENKEKNPLINHYDHYAFYIQKKWTNASIILGDFQIYNGLGMLIGQGYSSSFGNSGIQNLIQNRWIANANQTEYNHMRGIAYLHQYKKTEFNIGISKQKIDEGMTYGNHRTLNEISKKNKRNEELLVSSIVQHFRKQKHSILLLHSRLEQTSSLSYASQYYFRNATSFHEIVLSPQNIMYTNGISAMFNKNIQFSIAYTNRTFGIENAWASTSSQGFTNTTQEGISIHLSVPFKRKWNFTLNHKTSKKEQTAEDELGIKQSTSESLRIDRSISKDISITSILVYRVQLNDASKTNQSLNQSDELRIKMALKMNSNEFIQQEFTGYYNSQNVLRSKGLSYQTKLKQKKYTLLYSIGIFEIDNGFPIYYSYANVIVQRSTLAIYDQSVVQNIGINIKRIKRIDLGIQYTHIYNSIERTMKYKTVFNLKYN